MIGRDLAFTCSSCYLFLLTPMQFRSRTDCVLPDRSEVTMTQPFMQAYVDSLIQTCHRRGAHAMGGMAAQIPIKGDTVTLTSPLPSSSSHAARCLHKQQANEEAMRKVREDKLREVQAGHDGTWVAHPGLVPVAKEIFDAHMKGPNQIHAKHDQVSATAEDLVKVPQGNITEKGPLHLSLLYSLGSDALWMDITGLRQNVSVGLQYLGSWLRGQGCVPIFNLMEDAATAEISRMQVWSWMHHKGE